MDKIYIDAEFKCHVTNPDGIYTEIDTPRQIRDKCPEYIEGLRVRPDGYTYTENGVVYGPDGTSVEMWKDPEQLVSAQIAYERQQLAQLQTENAAIYQSADAAYQEGVNSI